MTQERTNAAHTKRESGEEHRNAAGEPGEGSAQDTTMGPEAWRSMMEAMCGGPEMFAGCCGEFRRRDRASAGARGDEPAAPGGKRSE